MNYDLWLFICSLISTTLDPLLLLYGVLSARGWNIHSCENRWTPRLARRCYLRLHLNTPRMHLLLDLVHLQKKRSRIPPLSTGYRYLSTGYRESRSQVRRCNNFETFSHSRWSKYVTITARSVGLPDASKSAKGSFSFWNTATIRHSYSPKGLLKTQLLTRRDPGQSTFTCTYFDWEQECISPTRSICIKSSHMHRLAHSYKTSVETGTSFDPIVNCFMRISNLIELSTEDINTVNTRRSPMVQGPPKKYSVCE